MEQKTYLSSWALITSLWPDWCPNDVTAMLCADRWGQLDQAKLQDCAGLHKMEASGGFKEPKIHRIMELYAERTIKPYNEQLNTERRELHTGPSTAEIAEWDKWAEDVLANVTEGELVLARELAPCDTPRILAIAVDMIRNKPKHGVRK